MEIDLSEKEKVLDELKDDIGNLPIDYDDDEIYIPPEVYQQRVEDLACKIYFSLKDHCQNNGIYLIDKRLALNTFLSWFNYHVK